MLQLFLFKYDLNDKTHEIETTLRPFRSLAAQQSLKMARSAHAYVRGSTVKFYEWLEDQKRGAAYASRRGQSRKDLQVKRVTTSCHSLKRAWEYPCLKQEARDSTPSPLRRRHVVPNGALSGGELSSHGTVPKARQTSSSSPAAMVAAISSLANVFVNDAQRRCDAGAVGR